MSEPLNNLECEWVASDWDQEREYDMGMYGLHEIQMACNRVIFEHGETTWAIEGYCLTMNGTFHMPIQIAGGEYLLDLSVDPLDTLEQRVYDWLINQLEGSENKPE